MASFKKIKKKWTVVFWVTEGERKYQKRLSGFDTKTEAEEEHRIFLAKLKSNNNEAKRKVTFLELAIKYKENADVRDSTLYCYNGTIKNYILPYFSKMNVFKTTNKDVYEYKEYLNSLMIPIKKDSSETKPLSLHQKQKAFSALVRMLYFAMKYFNLNENVAAKVGTFKELTVKESNLKKYNIWDESQFHQFMGYIDDVPKYKPLFAFLYYTGCRYEEACALNWSDVNFNTSSISFTKSITYKTLDDSLFKINPPKTKNGYREIKIDAALVQILKWHYGNCEKEKGFSKEQSFVFGIHRPFAPQTARNAFDRFVEKSELVRIKIHELRHSHVSHLIKIFGHSLSAIYAIAKRIGDTPEMILKTYGHMFPSQEDFIVAELEKSHKLVTSTPQIEVPFDRKINLL